MAAPANIAAIGPGQQRERCEVWSVRVVVLGPCLDPRSRLAQAHVQNAVFSPALNRERMMRVSHGREGRAKGKGVRAATPRVLEDAEKPAAGGVRRAVDVRAPNSTAPFVGRGADVRHLVDLRKRSRVLTLVGAGGIGKSHLARQFANTLASGVVRAVYLVDIDEMKPDANLWDAVASELGLAGHGPDQVIEHLAAQDVVLVIDNCDLRLGETAQLAADLLHNCGALQVVVTSREPLRVDGELVWAVPPLALPSADSPDLDEARASDAVRLFMTRMLVHRPEFEL